MFGIEMNSVQPVIRPDMDGATHKRYVEACSALVYGNDVTGATAALRDKLAGYIKERAARAPYDVQAMSEINAVLTLVVDPAILQSMELLGLMGEYHELGYGEAAEIETWKLTEGGARIQAANGDVTYPAWEHSKVPVATSTISAGMAVDYRELALGNFDSKLPVAIQNVVTDIRNRAITLVLDRVFDRLKNNTDNVKFYTEYTGEITQTAVDKMIADMRPLGGVLSIMGDFSVISAISDWVGYKVIGNGTPTNLPFYAPEQAMQMQISGVQQYYKGAHLVELPNPYNLTRPLDDKSGFERYYDANRTLFVPTGSASPIKIFRRGDITSLTGVDVKTGRQLTRYDLEIGADVVKGQEYMIGAMVKTGD